MVWPAHRPRLITNCFSRFEEVYAMADLNSEKLLDQMASSCWTEEKAVHCHPPVRVGSANFNEVPQFQVNP